MVKAMKCVLIGDESLLIQCAELIKRNGHAIELIVSASPQIHDWARDNAVPSAETSEDLAAQFAPLDFDWLFSIANLRMLPEAVWRRAKIGAVNFHDGPLPRFAGLNTPAWAILEGATQYGVTWHAIAAGADKGDILVQKTFDIAPDETALTLNMKCFEAGIGSFAELLSNIEEGTLAPRGQTFGERKYYGSNRRPEAAGTLDFQNRADDLSRLVRALTFGEGHANPLVTPKVVIDGKTFVVTDLQILDKPMGYAPGAVISVDEKSIQVATADFPVLLTGVLTNAGVGIDLPRITRPGDTFQSSDPAYRAALSEAVAAVVPHEKAARQAIASASDIDYPAIKIADASLVGVPKAVPLDLPSTLSETQVKALIPAFLLRLSAQSGFDIAYQNDNAVGLAEKFPGYLASWVPLKVEAAPDASVSSFVASIAEKIARLGAQGTYLRDIFLRQPNLPVPSCSIGVRHQASSQAHVIDGCAATFALPSDGRAQLFYDADRLSDRDAASIVDRLRVFAEAFARNAGLIAELPVMTDDEKRALLYGRNETERDYERDACVHTLIERQADLTPDAVAVAFRDRSITYRELDEQSNKVANALVAAGIKPDDLVGVHLHRSIELVVASLGIQKAGGAYVPLDPNFPADRISFMVEDSRVGFVLTDRALSRSPSITGATALCMEDLLAADKPATRVRSTVAPENLAYVIYTSGSTGRPKGVMVEHRNVVNFFAGMDERIPRTGTGQQVWLAVTSLSFDISVLELFWTLARGFKVVIHASELDHAGASALPKSKLTRQLDFGLFYWGNDDGAGPAKYQLLLEGAKFADQNGFQSVWTPERHFHAFGGPYPNPAVTGAAVAAVTRNLSIRAGSCVLPLHHPARVAEEWAIIDNLSNGRVALAFASGWMPEDFVLRPENAPPHNKAALVRDIEVVRKLWRGEKVEFDFGAGKVGVVTQPRPVQPEIPVWLTTAGNPDTYREAARLGANVLTHLLGQSIEELADKIRIYRETLVEVGRNPADHKVTLMLHTLIGEDREAVREIVREPMKDYLRSAAALIKQYAWAFPAFKKPAGVSQPMEIDLRTLSAEEMDAILEFAFLRYFEDSGLFGTPEDAAARIEQIAAIGVDDVACLIDFGVPSDIVLDRLKLLATVVQRARDIPATQEPAAETFVEAGLAADVRRHNVTHLQCTPSMAAMFLMKDEDRAAMRNIRHIFIGGEAFQGSLLADLRSATSATIENMYGPTETTIWSSTCTAGDPATIVPLGTPIANTQLYVLGPDQQPVPPGVGGELYIGGDGVTRGYLNREQLTAERFVPNPFAPGRMYRTGDLVRIANLQGDLNFIGRVDHQVKVRGYRIELGEIEARIGSFPGVREAVVVVQGEGTDVQIVAYLRVTKAGVETSALKTYLAEALPDFMVPAHFITLDAFPLTPNAKVDRKRLPTIDKVKPASTEEYVAPTDSVQQAIAETFRRALNIERVGLFDNFFALGGHSLLAVQVHRELKAGIAPKLTITDLFRFPSVAALASHVEGGGKADDRLSKVAERAAMRRNAFDRRAGVVRGRETG
jgi:natural product biosynthesis luciferase-like monooxygenase protein